MTANASGGLLRSRSIVVGVLGAAFSLLLVVSVLTAYNGNPTILLAVGEELPIAGHIDQLLVTDVQTRPGRGHDGQYFFLQATDPFLLEPTIAAQYMDLPRYRTQRVLYPLLAGLGGWLHPGVIVWVMPALSVAAVGLGTFAAAAVAHRMGGVAAWGILAMALNIGVLGELAVGGSGHLALAFALLSIVALGRGSAGWSVVALTLAVLTREVMLVSAVGLAIWLWLRGRRRAAVTHFLVPLSAVIGWAAYVRYRLDPVAPAEGVDALGMPFQGIREAFALWTESPLDAGIGVVLILVSIAYALRTRRDGPAVMFATVGFVLTAPFLSRLVWANWFDSSRAFAPVLAGFILVAFAGRAREPGASVPPP